MSTDLEDELQAINSIYAVETLAKLSDDSAIYSLTLPAQSAISLRIDFPLNYPNAPPSVLGTQHVGGDVAKGEGTYLVELVREVLAEVYTPGTPCIFDLIEESAARIQELGLDQSAKHTEPQIAQTNGQDVPASVQTDIDPDGRQQPLNELDDPPAWTTSEAVTEKKSIFIARAAAVTSSDQAKQFLSHLLATDKKVAKATHNITAWRISGENGVAYQDCDDDGETAAGGRVLHLLQLMGVWNAMVVVTRWYGGVHLGSDRFRLINQTAREVIVKGQFAPESGKESAKKKGKK